MCLEEKGGEGSSAPLLANPVQLNQYKSKDKAASFIPPPPPCSQFFSPLLAFLILPPSPPLRILLLLFISSPLSQLLPVPTCVRGLGSSWRSNSWQHRSIGRAESPRQLRSKEAKEWDEEKVGGFGDKQRNRLQPGKLRISGSREECDLQHHEHPESLGAQTQTCLYPAPSRTQGRESWCAQRTGLITGEQLSWLKEGSAPWQPSSLESLLSSTRTSASSLETNS